MLRNLKAVKVDVSVADGAVLEAKQAGDLVIKIASVSVVLSDTLYLPESSFNLVSLKHIEEEGFHVLITNESVIVFKQDVTPTIVATRRNHAQLYSGPQFSKESLDSHIMYDELADMLKSTTLTTTDDDQEDDRNEHPTITEFINSLMEIDAIDTNFPNYGIEQPLPNGDKDDVYNFHLMSNHMSIEKMLLMQKHHGLKLHISKENLHRVAECKICLLANSKQRSHNNESERKATKRLERIHTDTLGPFRWKDTKVYLTTIIDEATGYVEGIITDTKKVKDKIIQRLTNWNSRFQERIAYFRSDNAAEFPQAADLDKIGIIRETIAAYSPELNGRAEIVNHLVLREIYKVVLNFHPGVLCLIRFIIAYAITILNHSPKRGLSGSTPYSRFYQLSESNFKWVPFGIDCVVSFSNSQEASRYGISSLKGTSPTVLGAVIGFATDNFCYTVLLHNMRSDVIISPNVRILKSYDVLNTYLQKQSQSPETHIFPNTGTMLELYSGTVNDIGGINVHKEYGESQTVDVNSQVPYSIQSTSSFLSTGDQSRDSSHYHDSVASTIYNDIVTSDQVETPEDSQSMVSEYKTTPNPIHHELTPGENEVSKPPQLDIEASVLGKFKAPITTTNSDTTSIHVEENPNMETHALVDTSPQSRIGVPHSKEPKPTRTYHTGVDEDKKTLAAERETTAPPEPFKTNPTKSDLVNYHADRNINDKTKLSQPLVYISTGGQKVEMAETHTAYPNKDEESTTVENQLEPADNTHQVNCSTKDSKIVMDILKESNQKGGVNSNDNTRDADENNNGLVAKTLGRESKSAQQPSSSIENFTPKSQDETVIQTHVNEILAEKKLNDFDKFEASEIERETNDDDIIEEKQSEKNVDPQSGEHPKYEKAKKVYTFEKEVADKIIGVKRSTDHHESNNSKKPDVQPDTETPTYPITVKLNKRTSYVSPYVTRSGRRVNPPRRYLNALVGKIDYNDPGWIESINDEINKFKSKGVYSEVPIPDGVRPITMGWVHTEKTNSLKGVVRKSRCVAHGNRQREHKDFDPFYTTSPVTDLVTIRLLVIIGNELGMPIEHLDVEGAYLNANLTHSNPIYAFPPKSVKVKKGHCWLLHRSVYGLKQSGLEWYETLKKVLEDIGFSQILHNDGVFQIKYDDGSMIYLGLYVDDILMVGSSNEIVDNFVEQLREHFDLKMFGPVTSYLGIEFTKTESGYILSQEKFLTDLVKDFKLDESYGKNIPWIPNDRFDKSSIKQEVTNIDNDFVRVENEKLLDPAAKKLYQSGVGLLLWAAMNTRPDISFVVNSLGSKSANPTVHDYEKLIYCLRYVKNSMDYHIE